MTRPCLTIVLAVFSLSASVATPSPIYLSDAAYELLAIDEHPWTVLPVPSFEPPLAGMIPFEFAHQARGRVFLWTPADGIAGPPDSSPMDALSFDRTPGEAAHALMRLRSGTPILRTYSGFAAAATPDPSTFAFGILGGGILAILRRRE